MNETTRQFLRGLFSFDGCLSRRNWWLTLGGWMIFLAVLNTLDGDREEFSDWASVVAFISLWPLLAATVKRWHDRGKSGLWTFLFFVPLIGPFWTLIELGFLASATEYPHAGARRLRTETGLPKVEIIR